MSQIWGGQTAAAPRPVPRRSTIDHALLAVGAIYLGLIYFRTALAIIFPDLPNRVNAIVLALGALLLFMRYGARLIAVQRPSLWFVAAAAGVICASALSAGAGWDSVGNSLSLLSGTWLAWALFAAITETGRGHRLLVIILVICSAINSAVGVWGAVTGKTLFEGPTPVGTFGFDAITGRSGGVIGENYVGMFNLPAVVYGLWLLLRKRRVPLGALLVGLGVAATLASLSRSSVASLAAALLAMLLLTRRRLAALLLVAVVASIAWWSWQGILGVLVGRLPLPAQYEAAGRWTAREITADTRLFLWHTYLTEVPNAPLLGKGPGYIADRVAGGWLVPHNSFLDVLIEFGIVGLALYLTAFWAVARNIRIAVQREPSDSVAIVLAACFLGMATSLLFLSNPLARVLWVVAGALAGRSHLLVRRRAAPAKPGTTPARGRER